MGNALGISQDVEVKHATGVIYNQLNEMKREKEKESLQKSKTIHPHVGHALKKGMKH